MDDVEFVDECALCIVRIAHFLENPSPSLHAPTWTGLLTCLDAYNIILVALACMFTCMCKGCTLHVCVCHAHFAHSPLNRRLGVFKPKSLCAALLHGFRLRKYLFSLFVLANAWQYFERNKGRTSLALLDAMIVPHHHSTESCYQAHSVENCVQSHVEL